MRLGNVSPYTALLHDANTRSLFRNASDGQGKSNQEIVDYIKQKMTP